MQWLQNLSLKSKILLPGLLGATGFAMCLALNYFVAISNADKLQTAQENYASSLQRIGDNIAHLTAIKQNLVLSASTGDAALVDKAERLSAEMHENFNAIGELSPDSRARHARRRCRAFARAGSLQANGRRSQGARRTAAYLPENDPRNLPGGSKSNQRGDPPCPGAGCRGGSAECGGAGRPRLVGGPHGGRQSPQCRDVTPGDRPR